MGSSARHRPMAGPVPSLRGLFSRTAKVMSIAGRSVGCRTTPSCAGQFLHSFTNRDLTFSLHTLDPPWSQQRAPTSKRLPPSSCSTFKTYLLDPRHTSPTTSRPLVDRQIQHQLELLFFLSPLHTLDCSPLQKLPHSTLPVSFCVSAA